MLLAFFLSLPREIRYRIWYLFLDASSLSMTENYRITNRKGKQTLACIQSYMPRPDRQLAFYFGCQCSFATRMTKMARAQREGRIEHVGTTLTINLHTLFTTDFRNLGNIKRTIMLALQLKMVTTLELQAWDYIGGRTYHYYRCVPFSLFLEHIAPAIRKNPRHVKIVYESYYAPQDESDREMVMPWFLRLRYSETDPFSHIELMPIDVPVCQDWVKEIDATNLLGWEDQRWDPIDETPADMEE